VDFAADEFATVADNAFAKGAGHLFAHDITNDLAQTLEPGRHRRVENHHLFSPRLCSDDMHTLKQAAKGLGIVNLPAYTCRKEFSGGALVRVLPEWVAGTAQLSLVMPPRRGQSPSVRALADCLLNNVNARVGDRAPG
jgi:DNA-binding transcriptional LysR family regulator